MTRPRTLAAAALAATGLAATTLAAPAFAADYVAVAPPSVRGQPYDIGQTVKVAPKVTVLLLHASGDVTRRMADAAGLITVPPHDPAPIEPNWHAVMRVLLFPPTSGVAAAPRPGAQAPGSVLDRKSGGGGRTFGGARSEAACPAAEALTTLKDIEAAGAIPSCQPAARQALEALIARESAAE